MANTWTSIKIESNGTSSTPPTLNSGPVAESESTQDVAEQPIAASVEQEIPSPVKAKVLDQETPTIKVAAPGASPIEAEGGGQVPGSAVLSEAPQRESSGNVQEEEPVPARKGPIWPV
jgi:hypothetical protein